MGEKYDEDYPMSQEEINECDYPDENGVYPSLYEIQKRVRKKKSRGRSKSH